MIGFDYAPCRYRDDVEVHYGDYQVDGRLLGIVSVEDDSLLCSVRTCRQSQDHGGIYWKLARRMIREPARHGSSLANVTFCCIQLVGSPQLQWL